MINRMLSRVIARIEREAASPRPVVSQATARTGYTLVEMLVAVALVLLIMSMFAQIFQIATASISTQRGLMENDQRARTVQTVLLNDLQKRTFRYLVPYSYNEQLDQPDSRLPQRRGYFYISENNQADKTDDVLAFTVDARIKHDNTDQTVFYGRALGLAPSSMTPAQQSQFFRGIGGNQPDRDDSRLDVNNSGDSDAAEIVYFLRNGNLYRRVLLLRQQDPTTGDDDQPTYINSSTPVRFFDPSGAVAYPGGFDGATNFWNDFDYSAHSSQVGTSTPTYDGAYFNGIQSLDIAQKQKSIALSAPDEIAYPPNRFGHNYITRNLSISPPLGQGGQPKEFAVDSGDTKFLGRFTHEETSSSSFTYPNRSHIGSYVQNNSMPPTGGPRRGEDLLLTNVHSFDVKVFDDVLQSFVDIGHSEPAVGGIIGDYHIDNRINSIYGPNGPNGNQIFDTWFPFGSSVQQIDFNSDGSLQTEDTDGNGWINGGESAGANGLMNHENSPPYHPQKFWPDDVSSGRPNRLPRWQPTNMSSTTTYQLGDRVFPPANSQPGAPFYYLCVKAEEGSGGSTPGAQSGDTAPSFARVAGLMTEETNADGDQLTWVAVDNRKPLKAIQIQLRFLNVSTQQMRTLTIQHGLAD